MLYKCIEWSIRLWKHQRRMLYLDQIFKNKQKSGLYLLVSEKLVEFTIHQTTLKQQLEEVYKALK